MFAPMHRARRILGALLIGVFLPLAATSCFGSFQLTRKVYEFNRTISYDKWIRWITFLVFVVVPVYGFASLVDAVFANSVEFWTGNNPITASAGETRTVQAPDGSWARATWQDDGRVQLLLVEPGGREHTLWLVRDPAGAAALDASGRVVARLEDLGGSPRIVVP